MNGTQSMRFQCETRGLAIGIEQSLLLGSGGQANVYGITGNSQFAVKLYHKTTLDLINKLRIMIQNPPCDSLASKGHSSIAWPIDMVVSEEARQPVGFLMPRVNKMRPVIEFYNPKTRRNKCPGFSFLYLHRTARNLATAMNALHAKGYVVGDVNESNILVSETALVTLVDVDSFEVRDRQRNILYRCPVGRPDISAPELLAQLRGGKSFDSVTRKSEQDLFGLAVLIFQLLMEGTHPFSGVFNGEGDPPPCADRILSGHFPFSTRAGIPYTPTVLAPPFGHLHPVLQELFLQCFLVGHENPSARPTALEWQRALDKSSQSLVACKKNSQHIFWEHLGHCPWCERTQKMGGRDPFPFIKGETVPTLGADGQMGVVSLPAKKTQIVAPPSPDEPLKLKLSKPKPQVLVRQKTFWDKICELAPIAEIRKAFGEFAQTPKGAEMVKHWRGGVLLLAFIGYLLCKWIFPHGALIYSLALLVEGVIWFVQSKNQSWSRKWQPFVLALIGLLMLVHEVRVLKF